jgi:molybdopterin synthase catalytic subunit
MAVRISPAPFDPWAEARAYQSAAVQMGGKFGALSLFVGTMRDFNEDDDVVGMTLEYYSGMTEAVLEDIVREAGERWPVIDALVVHRVGDLLPGEPIVLVAVWTSHRGDAFDACRHIMEALKSRAPFWKKELLKAKGERWVTHNTDGYLKNE